MKYRQVYSKCRKKQNEIVINVNSVISNQNNLLNQMADLIQNVKENNALNLYCKIG